MSNNITRPLWEAIPRAIRWFNYCYSLPKVAYSSAGIMMGGQKIGCVEKPIAMTCSISEDYARLWLHFAQKALSPQQWDFLIVDSAGEMRPEKFPGCTVIRFVNLYHGQKVDLLFRHLVQSKFVFLCDDDKYILHDVMPFAPYLNEPRTPVVSLSPRSWWKFRIQGQEFLPMGSYALLLNRFEWLQQGLKLQSPAHLASQYKIFPPEVKQQPRYDTADYANEQLLLRGYHVVTLPDAKATLGFDGLSGPRILLIKYGKAYVKEALLQVNHYRQGSSNGSVMRAIYGIVKTECLYRKIFHEEPRFSSEFSEAELCDIVHNNPLLDAAQKTDMLLYFRQIEGICQTLDSFL